MMLKYRKRKTDCNQRRKILSILKKELFKDKNCCTLCGNKNIVNYKYTRKLYYHDGKYIQMYQNTKPCGKCGHYNRFITPTGILYKKNKYYYKTNDLTKVKLIQKVVRGALTRKKWNKIVNNVIKIQSIYRGYKCKPSKNEDDDILDFLRS